MSDMKKNVIASVVAFVVLMGLLVGIGLTSRGPTPATPPQPMPYPDNWKPPAQPVALGLTWVPAKPQPLAQRKVYVVVGSGLSGWPVSSAEAFIDRYTGSNWVMARSCPHSAYRCVFVRKDNGLHAPVLAATYGYNTSRVTIRVDVAYANSRSYTSQTRRKNILAHEFGHAGFLRAHSSRCGNLMYASPPRGDRTPYTPP